jgi:hypothetical protein
VKLIEEGVVSLYQLRGKNIYVEIHGEGVIIEFNNSAHFPRIEEPNLYAGTISRFINENERFV